LFDVLFGRRASSSVLRRASAILCFAGSQSTAVDSEGLWWVYGGVCGGGGGCCVGFSRELGIGSSGEVRASIVALCFSVYSKMHFCWAESVLTDLLGFPLFFFPCVASCLSPLVPHRWMCLLFLFCFYYFRSRL